MSYPRNPATLTDTQAGAEPSVPFLTQSHRNGVDQLSRSFARQRPLAILIGEGRATSRMVIDEFLSRLDPDVTVARVTRSCETTSEFMGEVISALGFEPKELGLDDLENIFSMYLAFQKSHHQRTIICIENVQERDWWVLDKIRRLVETECSNQFGLMLLIAGQGQFKELLNSLPLSAVIDAAGRRISLAPFTLPETREYLRRTVEAAGDKGIDEVFEYHAIPLIHELCGGVPDEIASLASRCFESAKQQGVEVVTRDLVKSAYELGRSESGVADFDPESTMVNVTSIEPRIARLVVQLTSEDVRELTLRKGNILIGRSKLCDIRIDSEFVSRRHALVSYSPGGATIVDLGSTNGTTVDGCEIKAHVLVPGETIVIGNCRIEYVLDEELQAHFEKAEQAAEIELNL
ncbi:MAG: FHA domain-containing protein [Gammaproteobacteria bacterium]|nr:FHA domain-containing protein [Gammaproteobacteria bacterium]